MLQVLGIPEELVVQMELVEVMQVVEQIAQEMAVMVMQLVES